MTRDDIADALDAAATWDECAPYPSSSRAALESRDADARRESAATYPGGRGTGANRTPQEPIEEALDEATLEHCKWLDELINEESDPAPSLTPQERKVAERAADAPPVPLWAKAMFDAQTGMIAEQAERIDGLARVYHAHAQLIREQAERIDAQADIIDQLHVANKHLAGRIDKVEDESIRDDVKILARISTLAKVTDKGFRAMAEFKARVIAAYPKAGEPTIQQQSAESWTQPKEEGSGE